MYQGESLFGWSGADKPSRAMVMNSPKKTFEHYWHKNAKKTKRRHSMGHTPPKLPTVVKGG